MRTSVDALACSRSWSPAMRRAAGADESVADFYRGKTLNIVVGHEAGTGYDFFGRTLARHITPASPGQSQCGAAEHAGRRRAARRQLALQRGRQGRHRRERVRAGDRVEADLRRRRRELRAGQVHLDRQHGREHRDLHGLRPLRDHVARSAVHARGVFGATGIAAPTSKFAYALVNFLGAKIKVVQGYKGSNDLRIALNRGEIEGACGPSHSTLKTQWKDDIDSGRIRALVQFGLKKLPDLQGRRAHLRLCEVERGLARSSTSPSVRMCSAARCIAPPGVPADRARRAARRLHADDAGCRASGRDGEARA